MHLRLS